jgi:hypothetical protein
MAAARVLRGGKPEAAVRRIPEKRRAWNSHRRMEVDDRSLPGLHAKAGWRGRDVIGAPEPKASAPKSDRHFEFRDSFEDWISRVGTSGSGAGKPQNGTFGEMVLLRFPPRMRSFSSHFFPVYATRQTVPEASSVTINAPSLATATPTGRPHTLPSFVTKPTRKSSNSPVALPSLIGTRMTL